MIRRRRPVREVHFSFDSFLDVVANVVGIIIRLILVVWVGARSYSNLPQPVPASIETGDPAAELAEVEGPLRDELNQQRRELEAMRRRLAEQLRQFEALQQKESGTERELAALAPKQSRLKDEQASLERVIAERARIDALSLEELRHRSQQLANQLRELEKQPLPKKALRYRTPLSAPVQSEELHFECRGGRITFIDVTALLEEARRGLEDKGKQLRNQWEIRDVTPVIGSFRIHYVIERERATLDAVRDGVAPDPNANYRYGMSRWQVEAAALERGEPLQAAMAADSEFRQIVDSLPPRQTVVTMWVYPDSFALFRQLRDYLYDREIVVAGRPLPEGVPISSSKSGSVSRGQ